MSAVNIPLLRKAVEWAEAEAAKPPELCEWVQSRYFIASSINDPNVIADSADAVESERFAYGKAEECGTCFCIAGFAACATAGVPLSYYAVDALGQRALGLDDYEANALFKATNSIKDVRRIAEEIAGERL